MSTSRRSVRPIQQFDSTSCWAASLEWFGRSLRSRPAIAQLELIRDYNGYWDSSNPNTNPNYGTVSRTNLIAILSDSKWKLTVEAIPGSQFTCRHANQRMRRGPIIVGYNKPNFGNHVVVVYGASNTHIACMDPDGARFHGRRESHYQQQEVIIGYPQ